MESNTVRAVKDITAGTVGGIAICIVGHPFDTLKVRLQTQPSGSQAIYSGLADCFKQTIKTFPTLISGGAGGKKNIPTLVLGFSGQGGRRHQTEKYQRCWPTLNQRGRRAYKSM